MLPSRVPVTNESLNAILSRYCPIEDILIYRRLALVTVTTHRDAVRYYIQIAFCESFEKISIHCRLYLSQDLLDQHIKVYVADSIHQPDNSNYPCRCTRFVSATRIHVEEGRDFTLFMNLPDSCILNIFKFVAIPDLVKLEWSSKRLNDLLNTHYKVRCKKIKLCYPKNERRNILDSLAAHHIGTLIFQSLQFAKYDCSTDNILYRLILKNCSQLKVLTIAHSHVPPFFWKAFDYMELEVLKMSHLKFTLQAIGDVISTLNFPKLHTLELKNLINMTCTPLLKLRNIHTFSLRECVMHHRDSIKCFLRNNANTIRNLDVFDAPTLNVAMEELTNVPNLLITPHDVPYNFDNSKFLMSVRHLTIDLRPILNIFGIPEMLRTFAAVHQLEKLRIYKNWETKISYVSATLDTQCEINEELLKFRNLKHVAFNITHVNDIIERFVQNNSQLETLALNYATLTIDKILDIIISGPSIQVIERSFEIISIHYTNMISLLVAGHFVQSTNQR